MSVSNGQNANATVFNNAFASKSDENNMQGKQNLQNADAASGTSVTNVQRELNGEASFTGRTLNGAKDEKPVWSSNNIGVSTDSLKARQDAVQAVVESNTNNITANTSDIADIRTTQGTSDGDTHLGIFIGTTISDNGTVKAGMQELENAVEARIPSTEKGAANGVATLDGSGLIPVAQLPTSAMTFEGNWNATTNSPTLADGTGTQGQFYNVSVGGTQDLGSGSLTFEAGDSVVHDGSVWVKIDANDSVTPTNSVSLTNKTIDADNNTISNLAHGAEVDNPSSGVHGVTGSVVGPSDAQVLTAKDIDGGTASNTSRITLPKDTTANLALLTNKQATVAYDTTLNNIVFNTGGGWAEVGSGTGSGGGINYSDNTDFETDVTTGVTDGTNITSAAETTNKIRGTQSLRWDIGTGVLAGAYGVLGLSAIDPADKGKALTLSFEYATDTDYSSDDVEIRVYDNTNTAYVNVNATESGDGMLKATSGVTDVRKFIGQFYTASNSTDYEIRFYVNSAPATASQIIVDNVKVGPESFYNMPIVSDPIDFTPSFTNFTLGNGTVNYAYYMRRGNFMEGSILVTLGSTSSVSGKITFTVPDSKTLDSNYVYTSGDTTELGTASYLDSGTALYHGKLEYESSTTVGSYAFDASVTVLKSTATSASVPMSWTTNDQFEFRFRLPISEWTNSSTMMSTTQANLQSVAYRVYLNSAQNVATSAETTVLFDTEAISHPACSLSSGIITIDKPGKYLVNVGVRIKNHTAEINDIFMYVNSTITAVNSNGVVAGTYDDRCITALVDLVAGDTIKVTVNSVSDTNYDLENASTTTYVDIIGIPDFTSIGVYSEAELIEASNTGLATYSGTASQWYDLTSITLKPGEWDISAMVDFYSNGATTTGSIAVGVSETSGNTAPGSNYAGNDHIDGEKDPTSATHDSLTFFSFGYTVTASTTLYLKTYAQTSTTNLQAGYKIQARRVK